MIKFLYVNIKQETEYPTLVGHSALTIHKDNNLVCYQTVKIFISPVTYFSAKFVTVFVI